MRLELDWYISGVAVCTYLMLFWLGGTSFLRSPAFVFITLLYVALFLIQMKNEDGERVMWPSFVVGGLAFTYLLVI